MFTRQQNCSVALTFRLQFLLRFRDGVVQDSNQLNSVGNIPLRCSCENTLVSSLVTNVQLEDVR